MPTARETMRMIPAVVMLAWAGLMAGCDSSKPVASGPIGGRLDAALAITDLSKRNSALAKVAEDAGAAGDADTAKKSIEKITDLNVRNDAAAAAAFKLAEVGKHAEATEVAKKITDLNKKDSVLSKLAKGG
jgi:hypothetical protein